MEEVMTLNDIAKYLKLSLPTIRNMVSDQKIPAHKIGRQWRFMRSEIDKWIINQTSMKEKRISKNIK